jgi:hypothetical protein
MTLLIGASAHGLWQGPHYPAEDTYPSCRGVVTVRLTDVGAYVNAACGEVGAHDKSSELFSIADVHKLRVFGGTARLCRWAEIRTLRNAALAVP